MPAAIPSGQVSVRSSLQITPSSGQGAPPYRSYPTTFNTVMYGTRGPTPGAILATNLGTVVSLSELSALGGLCRMYNNDLVNPVTWGIFIPGLSIFVPVGDILPQEIYVIRLSQYIQSEEPGTGTGSYGLSELMVRSIKGQSTQVTFDCFDP